MTKLSWLIMLIVTLAMGFATDAEAVIFNLNVPGISLENQQPIRVVIIDANGNPDERVAYYNSSLGGVDLDMSWAGPNASIYFPDLNLSYLWYNGYWIDQEGYYWSDGRRVFINDPNWQVYWNGYWKKYPHEHWHHHDINHRRWDDVKDRFHHWREERREGREDRRDQRDVRQEDRRDREDFQDRRFDRGQERDDRLDMRQQDRDARQNVRAGDRDRNPQR